MDAHLLRFDKAQWQEGQAKTMTSREHPETWGETGHGAPGKRGDCPEMLSAFLPDGPKQRHLHKGWKLTFRPPQMTKQIKRKSIKKKVQT
eukprot:scaffold12101_cov19-Tisochrysis_lutea.AAC.1